jgi:hypothetical protein
MSPFRSLGLWVTTVLLLGSAVFVGLAAWRISAFAAKALERGSGGPMLGGNIDIFGFSEVFVLLHVWFIVESFEWLRHPRERANKKAILLLAATLAILVSGHYVASIAAGYGISIGAPFW